MDVSPQTSSITNEDKAKSLVEALRKKGYTSHFAANKAAAKELALSLIPEGASIGFGGSATTRELGLVEILRENGHVVYDHLQPGLTSEEMLDVVRQHVICNVFLTSANAITLEGEIVNVDGTGNRVAASIFGPGCVIMIVGINKITRDLNEAIERSRQVAAVNRAKQANRKTPCTITGTCSNCSSPDRICNVTAILHRRPGVAGPSNEYHVIVVAEEIGF